MNWHITKINNIKRYWDERLLKIVRSCSNGPHKSWLLSKLIRKLWMFLNGGLSYMGVWGYSPFKKFKCSHKIIALSTQHTKTVNTYNMNDENLWVWMTKKILPKPLISSITANTPNSKHHMMVLLSSCQGPYMKFVLGPSY